MRYLIPVLALMLVGTWVLRWRGDHTPGEEGTKKMYPRWRARAYAAAHGYFWVPCPICGKPFGGMEWAADLMLTPSHGRGVCPDCVEEAHRRNARLRAKEDWQCVLPT